MSEVGSVYAWQGEIDGNQLIGMQYLSKSSFGIFIAKEAKRIVIGFLDDDKVIGYHYLLKKDIKNLQTFFEGNTEIKELTKFEEKRPIGIMLGYELQLVNTSEKSIRMYANLPVFDDQVLFALTECNKEFCCVAFNLNELISIKALIDSFN
ncbi:MAG: hypothetical protein AEth_01537 [Candidatus Argoarchaeum ethanivorans]|uniref:Uncharacterized protein n=1 Tax=Candidatus Argoarchaeum ethanivorans TaxID=2608793 RepID=A0A8B3S124_9EURY|nr:MAG: hypothetical protein AEth_01537 [Candidatus Argoarchaeum ethanivorans]